MPLIVNLRHLEARNLELNGELPVEELDLDVHDELVRPGNALSYALVAQKLGHRLLLQGHLTLELHCQCARCLKPFDDVLELKDWTRLLALEGEESVQVVNDCVDLTPHLREDILLEFPQHPLCEPECRGLPMAGGGKAKKINQAGQPKGESSAWAELDKLKL